MPPLTPPPAYIIEYNGYTFNSYSKSLLSAVPKEDRSGRIETSYKYLLRVSTYLTPRTPIPGDTLQLGIQLPAPWPQLPPPGLNPGDAFATLDSELRIILDRLNDPGRTLRYVGLGMGDLYVNTINPNTGLFVQDLNFGPHTKIIKFYPCAFKQSWYLEWEAECEIAVCYNIDFNNIAQRIQEFTYGVTYEYNQDGFTRRQISGKLIIIPPIYRGTDVVPMLANGNAPNPNPVFPSSPLPVNTPFGPFPTSDNVGNLQNYETADQYRDIIEAAFPIPFNFKRINRRYEISEDRRTISFILADDEQPAHSFIPGYSSVSLRQTTETAANGFRSWNSTITGTFKFPKFIYSNDVSFGYGTVRITDPGAKIVPKKLQAFSDFMNVVYQRFALAMVNSSSSFTVTVNPDGTINTGKPPSMTITPLSLTINENILANEISFSYTTFLSSTLESIWLNTGHGLPCILASDINGVTNPQVQQILQNINPNLSPANKALIQYALMVTFSGYTDYTKHTDWLASQIYASNSSRGSANLIFDPTFDRPLNTCLSTGILPIHLDSQSIINTAVLGSGTRGLQTKKTNLGSVQQNIQLILSQISALGGPFGPLSEALGAAITSGTPSIQSVIGAFIKDNGNNPQILATFNEQALPLINQIIQILSNPNMFPSSLDYDLLLSDDFGWPGASGEPLDNDIGYFNTTILPENISFEQLPTVTASFFNPTDQDITNKLFLNVAAPSPENSWIYYESAIELITDNTIIRHKLQPIDDLSISDYNPDDIGEPDTFLESNFLETVPIGPDNVVGNSTNDGSFMENYPEDDVIQYMGSPSNIVALKGNALRQTYPVVPPTLLFYGGYKCYQIHRRVKQREIAKAITPIYQCEWEIYYMLANTPQGYLPVPENPVIQEIQQADTSAEYDADLGDIYQLVE